MTLPLKILPLLEQWDCQGCGNCCRGSVIPLRDEDLAKLRSQKWEEQPEFRGVPTVVRQAMLSGQYQLAQQRDGSCVFLTSAGRCRIHELHGSQAKPLVCRMYPLQVVPLESTAQLTLRRSCPSAARDQGSPVAAHLEEGRELAREGGLLESAAGPPYLKAGERRDWRDTLRALQSLQRLTTSDRYPMVRRLVHGLQFCKLLEQARCAEHSSEQFAQLLQVLEEAVPDEAAPFFAKRAPPGSSVGVLFRQVAADYVRLHPRYRSANSWSERWRLFRAALAMVRGQGNLPQLHPEFPTVAFEALEAPLGTLDPAVYLPLNRFLETMATSYQYAIARRGTWSLIESYRSLALTYPIALWLLRWSSAGRQPTAQEAVEIVTALDRGQGYAPLSGRKQRSRLSILTRLEAIEPLIAWYGR